jgi:hypothetical protein
MVRTAVVGGIHTDSCTVRVLVSGTMENSVPHTVSDRVRVTGRVCETVRVVLE